MDTLCGGDYTDPSELKYAITYVRMLTAAAGTDRLDLDALLSPPEVAPCGYELEQYRLSTAARDIAALVRARRDDRDRYEQLLGQLVGPGSDYTDRLELSFALLDAICAVPREIATAPDELSGEGKDDVEGCDPVTSAMYAFSVAGMERLSALCRGMLPNWRGLPEEDELADASGTDLTSVMSQDLPLAIEELMFASRRGMITALWAGRTYLRETAIFARRCKWMDPFVVVLLGQLEQMEDAAARPCSTFSGTRVGCPRCAARARARRQPDPTSLTSPGRSPNARRGELSRLAESGRTGAGTARVMAGVGRDAVVVRMIYIARHEHRQRRCRQLNTADRHRPTH